jgi:hypothetical protein
MSATNATATALMGRLARPRFHGPGTCSVSVCSRAIGVPTKRPFPEKSLMLTGSAKALLVHQLNPSAAGLHSRILRNSDDREDSSNRNCPAKRQEADKNADEADDDCAAQRRLDRRADDSKPSAARQDVVACVGEHDTRGG